MLAVCLLQQLENPNDQAALDALSLDARWQHALGLTPEDAYLSRRSLVEFRRRLVTHDPDAGFGHKGLGYHVRLAETCHNDSSELLTDYEVLTAANTDGGHALPVIERLAAHNRPAEVLYADGGYPTPAQLVAARHCCQW